MGLRLLLGGGFQVLFHSPPGVLFTFPSRYWFTIGGQECLALEGGPPGFPQGFSCPGVLGWWRPANLPSATGLSPSLVPFSKRTSRRRLVSYWVSRLPPGPATPTTPHSQRRQAWHE